MMEIRYVCALKCPKKCEVVAWKTIEHWAFFDRFICPQPAARGLHGAGERERLSGYLLSALQ